MQRVSLNRALNKEIKYYGLSYLGLIGGGLAGCFVWLWLGMTIAIMGGMVGYAISSMWAKGWQSGAIQRFIYWHLPVKYLFGSKYLPASHLRCLL